ncbi:hypothetical protein [Labilibaculum filiforme]|nr:hypothetical protein [Labilibaculum filiforme]
MMFPNHEHHGHLCSHNTSDVENVCEIQEFDYFFFSPATIVCIPAIAIFNFEIPVLESIQKIFQETPLYYSLRAPPFMSHTIY